MDLRDDVFVPVAKRLRDRADSLREVRRFRRSGIEGWLKVEAVAALGQKIEALQNKGPDLLLRTGDKIQLKAATDLNIQYIREGATKYGTPCILLGDGDDGERIERISGGGVKLVDRQVLSDGVNQWVVGIVAPE